MPLLRYAASTGSMLEREFAKRIAEQMQIQLGQSPSSSELRSWERSIPVLQADLVSAGLGDVEMLVEYQLPLTSKRADVVLAGVHPTTGAPSYVIVELKQWTDAHVVDDSDYLVEVPGMHRKPLLHPVAQVRGYCELLADFTTSLAGTTDALVGVAYLHNAQDSEVADLTELPQSDYGRLYTGGRRHDFVEFLKSRFQAGASGSAAADALVNSAIAPSRQLLAVAAAEVQEREQFTLLDEQRIAYEYVLSAVERARTSDTKTVVIVTGGPGSGKSVIALSLLGELARQGRTVLHATGSRSFTQTLRKVAGRRSPRVQAMFKYFNSFIQSTPNDLEALILDEAHRIRETSESRWTKREHRTGRPQIDELVDAARVPVFLLDEFQVVRPGEQGTVESIEQYAQSRGIPVTKIHLDAQFRCGGSATYTRWVNRLLDLSDDGPEQFPGDPHFELQVADSVEELEAYLGAHRVNGYGARMAAGYCWPWSDPLKDGTLVQDVTVGGWARPWNLKGDRSVGGAPQAALWATDPAGSGQVGCVYTAQGFEYDYAGIIFGPDLVRRGGGLVAVRSANRDPDFRSSAQVSDGQFDRLVRHVYKVLLTRGMLGAVIYSTDAETREYLRWAAAPST